MLISRDWKDYELLDCSNKEKLERWNNIFLLRPDPQIIWGKENLLDKYDFIDAKYFRSPTGGGEWKNFRKINSIWEVKYKDMIFRIKQMGFKHTGLFPEQAVNWDYMRKKIEQSKKKVKVLNLFAYTGAATVACLKSGASVVHVDSSRGMVDWAKENVFANGLEKSDVRYIVDDVVKFVQREIRRGSKYDAIIMDPPSYGRGNNKEVWDIEKDIYNLVQMCSEILVEEPLFLIINTYTTGLSKEIFNNVIKDVFKNNKYKVSSEEIGLPIKETDFILPCGVCTRYEKND